MTINTIKEDSLYPPLVEYLKRIGFKSISQMRAGNGFVDIACFFETLKFIIEIKIEAGNSKWKSLLDGAAQAWNYSRLTNACGYVVIEYPLSVRNPLSTEPDVIDHLAIHSMVNVFILLDFWTGKYEKIKPVDLFYELKDKANNYLASKQKDVSLDFAVETIREAILTISGSLRQVVGTIDDLIDTVVGRFDLFLALAEESKQAARVAAIDLSAYLLVNQILFYHVYSSLTQKIVDFDEDNIRSISDLKRYFKNITDINYKAIYSVEIISNLPDNDIIIDEIRKVIQAIKAIRAPSIRHDLIGRVYHESLPYETRKRLATFYTKPIAGELLAGLSIDRWDQTTIDPACGSGTLLVAAYRRKEQLFSKTIENSLINFEDKVKLHDKFTQNDITGIDIMPFSCHLTAVNLSTQNPTITTNRLRVAAMDSLTLDELLNSKEFLNKGIYMKPFSRVVQQSFNDSKVVRQTFFSREGSIVTSNGSVGPEGVGEEFLLHQLDVVLMNPPFSDRDKMPKNYRNRLKRLKWLSLLCGNQVNLWGYFLSLSSYLLKNGGTLGAIIPINFLRGGATQKIRDYLVDHFHLKYIIKSIPDVAFSEAADFRDILLIAEKKEPKSSEETGFVFLKKSMQTYNVTTIDNLVTKIKDLKKETNFEDDEIILNWITNDDLKKNRNNLMSLLTFSASQTRNLAASLLSELSKNQKITTIDPGILKPAFTYRPSGLTQNVFITRAIDESRIERAFLIFEGDVNGAIAARIKGVDKVLHFNRQTVLPALRTLTGVDTMDLDGKLDYVLIEPSRDSEFVLNLSKWKSDKLDWKHLKKNALNERACLIIPRRIRLNSKNSKLLSFASEEPIVPGPLTWIVNVNVERIPALCLYFNSVLTLLEFLTYKSETTEEFYEMMKRDWSLVHVFNFDALSDKDTKILNSTYAKLKKIRFPSIIDQLKEKFWARVELDKVVLKVLGFEDNNIDKILSELYDKIYTEISH